MGKRKKLKELREENNLYQKDMAEMLNISLSFYSSIERGKRNPTLKLAKKISDLFDVRIEDIFFENELPDMKHNHSA